METLSLSGNYAVLALLHKKEEHKNSSLKLYLTSPKKRINSQT
jgi:hypothetical protein